MCVLNNFPSNLEFMQLICEYHIIFLPVSMSRVTLLMRRSSDPSMKRFSRRKFYVRRNPCRPSPVVHTGNGFRRTRRRALSGLGPVSQTCLAPPGAFLHVCEVVKIVQTFATTNHAARHTQKSIRLVQ